MTHPSPKRNMVPKAVLMRSGLVSLTTARPVNTAQPKTTVNSARPMTTGNPQIDLQDQGVIDSGCSRHMTGNMSYLTDFEEINGRYVAFEARTNLSQYNTPLSLASSSTKSSSSKGDVLDGGGVSSNVTFKDSSTFICATVKKPVVETSEAKASADKPKSVKKNNGAPIIKDWVSDSGEKDMPQAMIQKKTVQPSFTKIKFVKSKEQVKTPRKITVKQGSNFEMINKAFYVCGSFDHMHGKNGNTARPKAVVNAATPKAVLNAIKGNHVNVDQGVIDSGCSRHMTRNMSYLTDFEEINGGYVAFRGNPKGGKITGRDDYSRFSWVFFLATKDKTSGILKSFITGVENLIDQRVKVIRCDNRTEFKNKEMNQFCKKKGKFDGKAGEGFFVRYSINSKAFRVFDIDALTKSMNYKPVIAGNQSNDNAGTKACDGAGKARMEIVHGKDYILLPLWPADLPFSQNSKSSLDAGLKPLIDNEKKVTEEPGKESGDSNNDQEKEDDNVNNTNNVNTASDGNITNNVNAISLAVNAAGIEVNDVGARTSIELLDDPNMSELEDIVCSEYDKDVGAEADMTNLNTFIPVSPILTTRIHKDHPVEQIIRDLNLAPQTRRMTKNLEENGLFSSV
ncbi:retrovirus-related pol polyprotein from transposon TNT 1-94 [Tanacetum coccineum]